MVKEIHSTYSRWILRSSIILVGALVLSGCRSEDDESNEPATQIEAEEDQNETEVSVDEESAETEEQEAIAENELVLDEGTYEVGTAIPAGRYTITSEGMGNIFINENTNIGAISEVIEDDGLNLGVPSVTVDVIEGASVELLFDDSVKFNLVEDRELSNTLTTGSWEVGTDIEAGAYEVTLEGTRSGKITIFEDENGLPVYDEIIDGKNELGSDTLTLELVDGQYIIIGNIPELTFEQN